MKRKAFRTSGGKDRKAKKEKFVFTISSEEESSTAMEPNEDTHTPDMPQHISETSPNEAPPEAETTISGEHENPVRPDGEDSEKEVEVAAEVRAEDSPIVGKAREEEPPVRGEPPDTETKKNECVPDPLIPAFYNGPNLMEIRKRCGVSLKAISDETKISVRTLEDIESETYSRLPPEVYVKSFVRSYAKFLSLDPEKVIRDYMERYRIWVSEDTKKQRRKSSSGSIFGIKIKKSE